MSIKNHLPVQNLGKNVIDYVHTLNCYKCFISVIYKTIQITPFFKKPAEVEKKSNLTMTRLEWSQVQGSDLT